MTGDPYVYRGTSILINKQDIRDSDALERFERRSVVQRIREGVPTGEFDLAHLRAIHKHLFQDVYEWAGKIRTLDIAKGGHHFQAVRFIETGMADIHRRLSGSGFLAGLSSEDFAEQAGVILGDVNYVHPFREGNGRTQLQYLKQLGSRAGHPIDLRRLEAGRWHEASRLAHGASYKAMAGCIAGALSASGSTGGGSKKGKGKRKL